MSPPSRRFEELQKRLQRRNNSLRPSDYCNRTPLSCDRNLATLPNGSHLLLSANRKQNPSLLGKTEGFKKSQGHLKESQENVPKLAESKSVQEEQGADKKEENSTQRVETLAEAIIRMRQNRPPMRGYLPVAAPHPVQEHQSQQVRHQENRHVDAEQEYRTLFQAPSHIEVHQVHTFDDGITEVSEITTDIRTRSTKGATYVEQRMAGKMRKMLEEHDRVKRVSDHLHIGGENIDMGSYMEVDVTDIKELSKAVERAKFDLQQKQWNQSRVVTRHGLPYESTDFRAEGDDEESEDSWDDAIRGNLIAPHPRQALDPEDGEILCVQGPPTPRTRPSPESPRNSRENIQGLIKETVSSDGDVVLDTTEICDEDLDGSQTNPIRLDERIRVDDITIGTSMLLGEEVFEDDPNIVSKTEMPETSPKRSRTSPKNSKPFPKQGKVTPKKKDFVDTITQTAELSSRRDTTASDFRSTEDVLQSSSPKKDTTTGLTSSQSGYKALYIQNQKDSPEETPVLIQHDCHSNKTSGSGFYNSSLGYFKSFASQLNTHLNYIKRQGLITESDMDGMLGVLGKGMEETSSKIPKEADDMIIFLGDEFEKSTCGANTATGEPGDYTKEIEFPTYSVEKMLDSLKATYKKSLAQCGAEKSVVEENSNAIEDMVTSLKKAYGTEVPGCGEIQDEVLLEAAQKLDKMDQKASSVACGKTMTLMDDAAVGSYSFTNLVKQLQEQQQQVEKGKAEGGKVDKAELKQRSFEAVDEFLSKANEAKARKLEKLSKLKSRNGKASQKPEPQTFIVPIAMPTKSKKDERDVGKK